jgi:hypothetical protein
LGAWPYPTSLASRVSQWGHEGVLEGLAEDDCQPRQAGRGRGEVGAIAGLGFVFLILAIDEAAEK